MCQKMVNSRLLVTLVGMCFFMATTVVIAKSQTQSGSAATTSLKSSFSAGSAECQQSADRGNVCTYRQNAEFIDNDTKLWAPTIVVYRDEHNQTVKIQAIADKLGHKAHYHGVLNPVGDKSVASGKKDAPVDANANVITIYPPKNLMTFDGQARIVRGNDTITGSYLEYNTVKQTVLTKPTAQEVTTIMFEPEVAKDGKIR